MFSIQRGGMLGGMFFYFLIKKDMSLFGCVDVWINLRRCDECRIAVGEGLAPPEKRLTYDYIRRRDV